MEFATRFVGICFAIFLIFWIVAAFSVKRTLEKQPSSQRFLLLGSVAGAFLLLRFGGILSASWNLILWERRLWTALLADVVVLGGLAVTLWARVTLGGNWSASVTFKENHELIERGLYRYVRHPIYSGLLVMVLGTAVLFGRLFGFLGLAIVFLGFWLKSQQEERLLIRHFPEAYPEYKRRVRALIPFVF